MATDYQALFDRAEQFLSEACKEDEEAAKLIRALLDAAYRLVNERDEARSR